MRQKMFLLRSTGQSGFSITELLVIIIIATILIAASVPALRKHTQTAKLKQASDEVAATLKLARQRAVATSNPVLVVFDSNGNTYYLFEDEDDDGIYDAGETQSGPYDVPKSVVLDNVSFANGKLTFGPRGSASETGSVVLVNALHRAQRVDVNAATGLVYVSGIYAYEGYMAENQ